MSRGDINNRRNRRKKWNKEHRTPEKYRMKNIRRRERRIVMVNQYLLDHPCVDCGESDVRALQFDYPNVDSSLHIKISTMVQKCRSIKDIQLAMEECEVRCANCHIIITIDRGTPNAPRRIS